MAIGERPPNGPRGFTGAAGEAAAAARLRQLGWLVLGRNLVVAGVELDLIALEPGFPATLVVVEVRSRSRAGFGAAVESVDRRKVVRLYRAAMSLRRLGHPAIAPELTDGRTWRIDLITMERERDGTWVLDAHLRGIAPP